MDANVREILAKAWFEVGAGGVVERVARRSQHVVHDGRNLIRRRVVHANGLLCGALQQRITTALLIRLFLLAFFTLAAAGVLPAVTLALQRRPDRGGLRSSRN